LGDSRKTGQLICKGFCSRFTKRERERENWLEITDIDSFVRENNVNLGVIKLDVEGLESEIIRGAIESIKKYKPVLLISIYHTPEDFFHIKPFIENLNLSYNFLIRKLAPQRPLGETMLIGFVDMTTLKSFK
jgi:hypothetical protein